MQRVGQGETPAAIARRFHVPVAVLAAANSIGSKDMLAPGSLATVPLGPYNLVPDAPQTMSEVRPLYYRAAVDDRLKAVARRAGLSAAALADRNGMGKDDQLAGRVLLVGWVRYDATPMGAGLSPTDPLPVMRATSDAPKFIPPPSEDTLLAAAAPKVASLSQLYKEQTFDGKNVVTERGSAGFFPLASSSSGAAVYAFHNTAAKGSVMIVRNLNNGKAIYVKVLGPLPETSAFAGCIVGLSNQAKAALGVRERKAFCELTYPAY